MPIERARRGARDVVAVRRAPPGRARRPVSAIPVLWYTPLVRAFDEIKRWQQGG